jgi:hypothetical protein
MAVLSEAIDQRTQGGSDPERYGKTDGAGVEIGRKSADQLKTKGHPSPFIAK